MAEARIAPCGSWTSPITSDLIVAATVGLTDVLLDGEDLYWTEMRPAEGGRYVLVKRAPDGATVDVTPPGFNARTRVHEYGGAACSVHRGTVVFTHFEDQRLYRQRPGEPPQPIAPEGDVRHADGVFDGRRGRFLCVREDHSGSDREAVNSICSVDLAGEEPADLLCSGRDFYAAPRLSPDGSRLAWLEWDHPNMPWDGTELCVAELAEDGSPGEPVRVAGGPAESVLDPQWSPDGTLYFVSDRTDWWNLYRWRGGAIEPVCATDAEFAAPAWVFGRSMYTFAGPGRIVCAWSRGGRWSLGVIDTARGELSPLDTPYTDLSYVCATETHVCARAGSPTVGAGIVRFDLATGASEVLRTSSEAEVAPGYLSEPRAIEFPTEGGLSAHALYYAPKNAEFATTAGERPPLIVTIHGGPTGACTTSLNLTTQFWTSRGFGVVDVNYGGSTGYGRAYRERLKGQWGIVDVDDCVNVVRYLAGQGEADGERAAIRGGSAGGWTTLCALAFRDVFQAGASYFGVSDAEALARETHKFESRYLDGLIAPYPEGRDVYRARSAIYHVDGLSCPLILFQGLEDKIVLPNQAERMFDALKAKGIPVAYLPFEGEQHGFRIAANIKRSLDAELYFYSRVFGFTPADVIEPVEIENL